MNYREKIFKNTQIIVKHNDVSESNESHRNPPPPISKPTTSKLQIRDSMVLQQSSFINFASKTQRINQSESLVSNKRKQRPLLAQVLSDSVPVTPSI